jgi:hypothetical protein
MYAVAIPVNRFVAPGPLVAMHTPVLPVARGVAVRHMRSPLLVPGQDVPDGECASAS